jgi:regulator of replication initiation timing
MSTKKIVSLDAVSNTTNLVLNQPKEFQKRYPSLTSSFNFNGRRNLSPLKSKLQEETFVRKVALVGPETIDTLTEQSTGSVTILNSKHYSNHKDRPNYLVDALEKQLDLQSRAIFSLETRQQKTDDENETRFANLSEENEALKKRLDDFSTTMTEALKKLTSPTPPKPIHVEPAHKKPRNI